MDFLYLKVVLLVNGWLFAKGSPVAMLQHATSSQSIVFHAGLSESSSTAIPSASNDDRYGNRQPKYEYKYEVNDQQTGDRKSHWETRDGDRVRGAYTLYEPDGALRTVEYTADALHGFNAVVKRNEPNKHQFSGRPSQSGSSSPNRGFNDHDSIGSGQVANRNIFTTEHRGTDASFSVTKSAYDSGVGFSVNHVLKKYGGSGDF